MALTYNLYWDTVTPVTILSNKIAGVVSPYDHQGLINNITYYYAITSVNEALQESALSNEIALTPGSGLGATSGVAKKRFEGESLLALYAMLKEKDL